MRNSISIFAILAAINVSAFAAPPDNQKVATGVSVYQAQLDDGSTDPAERYSYLDITAYSNSNPPVRRAVMDVPVPNVNNGDILQIEGALQVTMDHPYAVELTCKAIYTPSRGSTELGSSNSGVVFKEHGYNVSPQDTRITIGVDEYRPLWAKSSTNKTYSSENRIINSRFAGMHHGIFPFAASVKIDQATMVNQDLYVDLVCYAGGGSETQSGDRLTIDYNGHMSVMHHYEIPE